jgi:hypothetical protein
MAVRGDGWIFVVPIRTVIFGEHEFNHTLGNAGVATVDANGDARIFGHFQGKGSERIKYEVLMVISQLFDDLWNVETLERD